MKTHRITRHLDLSAQLRAELENSFFSSKDFSDLWGAVGGHSVWWVVEKKGEQIAVLPGVEFGKKLVRRLQCMPDGCYARLAVADGFIRQQKELGALIIDNIANYGYAKTYITDFDNLFDPPDKFDLISHTTTLCDISESDWQPPDKKLQAQIRKAQREGVEVRRFNVISDFDSLISLVKKTEDRHEQRPKYDRTFFEALARLDKLDQRVIWYFCEHDHAPVASQINFVCDDTLLSWQTFSDRKFSNLKANQLMLQTAINEATASGVLKFNPGLSPQDAEGLKAYKLRWGGVSYNYNTLVRRQGLGRVL